MSGAILPPRKSRARTVLRLHQENFFCFSAFSKKEGFFVLRSSWKSIWESTFLNSRSLLGFSTIPLV